MNTAKMTLTAPVLAGMLLLGFLLASPAAGKKPATLANVPVQINGNVIATSAGTNDVRLKTVKGKPHLDIWALYEVDNVFAKVVDFFPGQFGDPDGENCFDRSPPPIGNGVFRIDVDGAVFWNIWPEFFTADPDEPEPQNYILSLEGRHNLTNGQLETLADDWPVTILIDFDHIEILTEGRGQKRRITCRGTFWDEGGGPFDGGATGQIN